MPDQRTAHSRTSSRSTKQPVVPAPQRSALASTSSSQSPLKPKKSKTSSLWSLFSRPNVERAKGHSEPIPPAPVAMPPPDIPLDRPSTRQSVRSTRSRPTSRLSFLSRGNSLPPETVSRPASRLSVILGGGGSKPVPSTTKLSQPQRPRVDAPWDPPPLFQAYPQALKHTLLKTPGPNYDPTRPTQGYNPLSQDLNSRRTSLLGRPKSRQGGRSDIKSADKVLDRWTKKVYILVTSGHLLEYAGDGPYDRLPDKVLKLGRGSAAFASDLIPGFPYVLQVLQTASSGIQVVQLPQKSFRSRLGLQSASSKRIATSMLLVFDEADQMDSWMISIRKEIEALGGKRSRPDSTMIRVPNDEPDSPATITRYEGIQRSPSRQSTTTTRSTRTLPSTNAKANPSSFQQMPAVQIMQDRPWTSLSQRPRDMESVSEAGETDSLADTTTTPPVESHSFADNWFTDLAPQNQVGNGEADTTLVPPTRPIHETIRRSSDIMDGPFMGLSRRQASSRETHPQGNYRGVKPRSSNFSLPRRYSMSPKTYAQSGEATSSSQVMPGALEPMPNTIETLPKPMIPGTNLYTQQTVNAPGLEPPVMSTYSDVSTASNNSNIDTSTTASELSTQPSTRTSTFTLPSLATAQQWSNLDGRLSPGLQQSDSSTPTPTSTVRKSLLRPGAATLSPVLTPSYPYWSSPSQASPASPQLPQSAQFSPRRGSPSPTFPNLLRRPPSFSVNVDPAPFLSAMSKSNGSVAGSPSGSYSPQFGSQRRTSTQVPIVRPPSIRHRQQAMNGGQGAGAGVGAGATAGLGLTLNGENQAIMQMKTGQQQQEHDKMGNQASSALTPVSIEFPPQMPAPTGPLPPKPEGMAV